jgi:replicative DNA helicase
MTAAAPSANGDTTAPWKEWRETALGKLPLEDVYGQWMTGKTQGKGWLECRDPASPTGDRRPSAGVADGSGKAERGRFKSFRTGEDGISVFDFLVEISRATDFRHAQAIVAELTGVPLPIRPKRSESTWANGQTPQAKGATPPRTWYVVDWTHSSVFATKDYRPRWLVRRLLVRGQPGFAGGPSKSLKTSIMIDLALGMASGRSFLGTFDVPEKVRVGVLSGESGEYTLQETARRVCEAKGIDLATLDVFWGFRLPQLADQAQVDALALSLSQNKIEVLILDPVYLSLLAGVAGKGLQASNLMDIGPLLLRITAACLDVGCTPLLVHHTRKNLASPYQPLDLDDLAFSGCGEFARQWLLINRREEYEHGTGTHRMWLVIGGSCGQSGLWAADIEEGQLEDDFTGRRWEVIVANGAEVRDLAKAEKAQRAMKEKDGALLAKLDLLDPKGDGIGVTRLRSALGWGGQVANAVISRLTDAGIIEECEVSVKTPNGGSKTARGVRRFCVKKTQEESF